MAADKSDNKDDDQEFDFASFIQSPMALMMSAVSAADTAKKTVTGLVEAVNSLQRSAKAFESILERIDNVVSEIEKPAKVLGPEMERLAGRMRFFGDAFDRVQVDQLPETLELLMGQLTGVVGGLAELPKRLGPLGDLLGGATAFMGLGRPSAKPSVVAIEAPKEDDREAVSLKKPTKKPATKKPAAKKFDKKAAPKKKR
jgi:hypothetical protein